MSGMSTNPNLPNGATTDSAAAIAQSGAPQKSARGKSSGNGPRDWRHLATLFDSLPPHAIEAEMSLLGSILIEPQVLGDVIFVVKKGDEFFKPANGAIFDAMVELYDKHSSLDIVQLNQRLVDRNALDAVGGLDYLVQLASAVPSASNAVHYARLVREKAVVRQLIGAAGDILYDAYHSSDESQSILDRAEAYIFHIAQQTEQVQIEALKDLINDTVARLEANERGEISGLHSGFAKLDEMTTGLQRGEMIIIAARPSMGKTALALNIAENMAVRGTRVGIFSLEMSKQQLVQRLLCSRSGVQSQRLRRGMLQEAERRALWAACGELMDAPIFIDDTPGLSLLQLRTKARRMAAKHKVDAVFVDYMQLLTTGGRVESRQVEVSEISRGIKALARELQVPVICLSQLNRGAEQREGNRPRMSDLRESGSIEQDADVVALLHREEYYHKDDRDWVAENPEKVGVAELIISKQRNGPTGTVELTWIADCTRFRDYVPDRPQPTFEPKYVPESGYRSGAMPSSSVASASSAAPFGGGRRAGSVDNYRDGGGPDRDEAPRVDADDDIPI